MDYSMINDIATSPSVLAVLCIMLAFVVIRVMHTQNEKREDKLINLYEDYRKESREREQSLLEHLEQYENVEVRLSREDDHTLTLKQRTDIANTWGTDYFIGVHINAGGGTGFETFIWNGDVSAATRNNQNIIHREIMKAVGNVRDCGKKIANFHVVRESNMPAILPEFMFIDNANDARLLKDPAFLNRCAKGMENGLATIFNLKKKAQSNLV